MIQPVRRLPKWLTRVTFLLATLLAFGVVSFIAVSTVCSASIPSTTINEPISTFVGTSDYDAQTLILKAEQVVSDNVRWIARAGSGYWTQAVYFCHEENCQLRRLQAEVGAQRYIACFRTIEGFGTSTDFIFDMDEGYVRATTYGGSGVRTLSDRQLRELSPTIEEALHIALSMADQDFLNRHPEIEVVITKSENHWTVELSNSEEDQMRSEVPFQT
ncbi:MAG: hypothetical protein K8J31_22560 [Anaerolineae bacterium]|nr:hypothetical protein [Anaerolineae bacterium]